MSEIDLDAIRRRVDAVGDEPLNWGPSGNYFPVTIKRCGSWNNDVLAGQEAQFYADLFAHARNDIWALLAEVERTKKEAAESQTRERELVGAIYNWYDAPPADAEQAATTANDLAVEIAERTEHKALDDALANAAEWARNDERLKHALMDVPQ